MNIKEFKQILISKYNFKPFLLQWNISNDKLVKDLQKIIGEDQNLILHEVSDTFDLDIKNTDDGLNYQIRDVHLGMEMRDLLRKIYD